MDRLFDDARIRVGDIQQLARIAATYPNLERFLTELTLEPPQATSGRSRRAVAGRGLPESCRRSIPRRGVNGPAVTAAQCGRRLFGRPTLRHRASSGEIEEERRLLYVAMTARGGNQLDILVPQRFHVWAPVRPRRTGMSTRADPVSIPDAMLDHFEQLSWPTAAGGLAGGQAAGWLPWSIWQRKCARCGVKKTSGRQGLPARIVRGFLNPWAIVCPSCHLSAQDVLGRMPRFTWLRRWPRRSEHADTRAGRAQSTHRFVDSDGIKIDVVAITVIGTQTYLEFVRERRPPGLPDAAPPSSRLRFFACWRAPDPGKRPTKIWSTPIFSRCWRCLQRLRRGIRPGPLYTFCVARSEVPQDASRSDHRKDGQAVGW